ncbi:MAG: hypothetical protein RBR97_19145 [Bacteroidales bacterium]|nr:hypothetical protein [Bacteroidales bacterium]
MTLSQRILLKAEFFWFKPNKKQIKYTIFAYILWAILPVITFMFEHPARLIPASVYLIIASFLFLALCSKTFVKDDVRKEYKILEYEKSFNELFKK